MLNCAVLGILQNIGKDVQSNALHSASRKMEVGQHDAPVKEVFWVDEMKMICSASWDKTIRFWTGTQVSPTLFFKEPICQILSNGICQTSFIFILQKSTERWRK